MADYTLSADYGSTAAFTWTGVAATFGEGFGFSATTRGLIITGIDTPLRPVVRLGADPIAFTLTGHDALRGALELTRQVNITVRLGKPATSVTMKFYPDLSAGDSRVILEKVYTTTLLAPTGSTTLTGSIVLPVFSTGAIPYRVQFPKESGYSEHYIYLAKEDSSAVDLATLLSLGELGTNTVDLTDLNDVTITSAVDGEYLRYNGSEWVDSAIQVGDLPASVMLQTTYDTTSNGMVDQAEQVIITVRNSSASTLSKGTIVYISGANGTHVIVSKAQANSEEASSKTVGMVIENISAGADGKVALNGTVDGVNTFAIPAGSPLWLSAAVAGGYTIAKPTPPNHGVFIGWVARSNASNGRIVLHIQNGYELDELHDVLISSKQNNDLLVYESATSLWKNKSKTTLDIASDSAVVKLTGNQTVAGNKTFTGLTKGNFQPSTSPNVGPDFTGYFTPDFTAGGLITLVLFGDADIAPPTGTPTDGAKMLMRLNADTAGWSISWDSIYRAGNTPLPVAILPTQTIYLGFLYNLGYWDLVGYTLIS